MTQRSRRIVRLALAGAVVIAAVIGAAAYRHHHRYNHVAAHDPGKVYRCAWVEADVMRELVETYHARAVLNLCRPGEMGAQRSLDERKAVAAGGATLYELPMPETDDPSDPELQPHLDVLRNPDNYPLIVHCQHGVNRTARVLSMYDILFRGMTAEQSLGRMPKFGRRDYNPLEWDFARNLETRRAELFPDLTAHKLDAARR